MHHTTPPAELSERERREALLQMRAGLLTQLAALDKLLGLPRTVPSQRDKERPLDRTKRDMIK